MRVGREMVSKLLVADDDEAVARGLAFALYDLGDADIVQSGRAAIRALERSLDYAFLLLDVRLGQGMDAFDVAVFGLRRGFHRPIFLISGQPTGAMLARANELELPLLAKRYYVEKPTGAEALKRFVLAGTRIAIDEDDPRLLEELERAGIRSPISRKMLVGLMNRRSKERLLCEIPLTKEQWHFHAHRILTSLGLNGRTMKQAAQMLYRRVVRKPRPGRDAARARFMGRS